MRLRDFWLAVVSTLATAGPVAAAGLTVQQLPAAGALGTSDVFWCGQGTHTYNCTAQQISTYARSQLIGSDITTALGYTPLAPSNNLSDVSSSAVALNNLAGLPRVANNAALQALASTAFTAIVRMGFATAGDAAMQVYTSSNAACSLNAGAGDGGSQVPTSNGKCWLANPNSAMDLREWGDNPDGSTNNAAAINAAAAWAVANGTCIIIPPGSSAFASAMTWGAAGASNWCAVGIGPKSILLYTGANATNDLITIGSASTPSQGLTLSNFRIASNTTMTGGAALHLRNVGHSVLTAVIADGQLGNAKLYTGCWFDGVDSDRVYEGQCSGQHVDLQVNGGAATAMVADLWIIGGKYVPANNGSPANIGVLVGGGFGGLHCIADITSNGVNFQIDHSLYAVKNRETFLESGCTIDSSTAGPNVLVNDSLAAGSTLVADGWNASAAGSGADGIDIRSWPASTVTIGGSRIFNNAADGVLVEDSTAVINIGAETQIQNNGGYGVNCSVTTDHIYPGSEPLGNVTAAWASNCHVENLNANNGYKKEADGTIEQWFTVVSATGAATTTLAPVGGNPVSFPLTFPGYAFAGSTVCGPATLPNGAQQITIMAAPISAASANVNFVGSSTVTNNLTATCRVKGE